MGMDSCPLLILVWGDGWMWGLGLYAVLISTLCMSIATVLLSTLHLHHFLTSWLWDCLTPLMTGKWLKGRQLRCNWISLSKPWSNNLVGLCLFFSTILILMWNAQNSRNLINISIFYLYAEAFIDYKWTIIQIYYCLFLFCFYLFIFLFRWMCIWVHMYGTGGKVREQLLTFFHYVGHLCIPSGS